MVINFFKIIAIIGLLILTAGVLTKKSKKQNIYFVAGGILLIIYSISIKDLIIVMVQSIFTIAAVYNLIKVSRNK